MSHPAFSEQNQALREVVREGYTKIAQDNSAGCCGPGVFEYVTSLEVEARKSAGGCCGENCCPAE